MFVWGCTLYTNKKWYVKFGDTGSLKQTMKTPFNFKEAEDLPQI